MNHLSEGSATELQANLPLYDSSLFKQILAKLPLIAVKTIFDFDQAFRDPIFKANPSPMPDPAHNTGAGLYPPKIMLQFMGIYPFK